MPIDMSHPYGQLLATMSRRQLLDIALETRRRGGAADDHAPGVGAAGVPQLSVFTRRGVGRSLAGRASCCGPGWRPSPSRAAACRRPTSKCRGRSPPIARSGTSSAREPRSRGRSLATACTSRPRASRPAANTSIASAAAARPARSGAPRPRRRPARRSIACASACAAAAITRPATSPATAGWPTKQFDFVFHTGDYIYEGRGDANRNPEQRPPAPADRRSTRSSTIATATRSTSPIRI